MTLTELQDLIFAAATHPAADAFRAFFSDNKTAFCVMLIIFMVCFFREDLAESLAEPQEGL